MLTEPRPPLFRYAILLALITTLCLCVWQGIASSSRQVRYVAALFAWLMGGATCTYTGLWLAWHAAWLRFMFELVYTRRAEAIQGMNDDQVILYAYDIGARLPPLGEKDGLVVLPNGDTVEKRRIARIVRGMDGDRLPAERLYTNDQAGMRQTYDKLAEAQLIEPAGANTPPRATREFMQTIGKAR